MVELALQALPPNLEPARVLLHADDLQIVAQHIGQDFAGRRIALVADRNLTRGGCRVVTASTDVDNTLESRWTRVTGVLGGQSWPALDARDLPVAAPIATTPARADAAAVASAPALPESS
jgi:flagellar biosynthesis/type III secretory pathway protein FliH